MSETGARKLKLLLITSGCDNGSVGESWVAFQWVSRLAKRHDVTLLTCRYSSMAPTALQLPGVRVIEWQGLPLFEKWERFNALLKPGYVGFYLHVRKWLKQQLRSGETFDLIHQITPNALRYPSPAVGFGVPLVIGPRGGCLDTPPGFRGDFGKVPWYTQLRKTDKWRLRHDPVLRRTYASADGVIGVAPYVKELLGGIPSRKAEVEFMTETGILDLPPQREQRGGPGRPRLLFVGRVIRSKGVRDLIRALAELKDIACMTLDVVGVGEDMAACKKEAIDLGVGHLVKFHGWQTRSEVDAFYAKADVFVFPSFREPSGIVVVEAMSHGLAMIVADRGGPGFVVDASCGFRVPVINPKQFASGIAASIRKLAQNPDLIDSMGVAAREKIKRGFLWDTKIDQVSELYYRILARAQNSNPYSGGRVVGAKL
jgi:glycosyltransferase involved in cell wall biosynthesis